MKNIKLGNKVIKVSNKDYQCFKYFNKMCVESAMCVGCPFRNNNAENGCEFYATPYKGYKFYPFSIKFEEE